MSGSIHRNAENGQGLVEYAILLMLVGVIVIGVLAVVGGSTGNLLSNVVCHLNRDSQCQSSPNSNSSQAAITNTTGSGNCGNDDSDDCDD